MELEEVEAYLRQEAGAELVVALGWPLTPSGAGTYDDLSVDQALSVFARAVADDDPRTSHLYFEVSGIAGYGQWKEKAELIVARIRQLGVERILFGSDGASGGGLPPREAWAAFRRLPLSDTEFQTIANNVAPYMQ